MGTRRTKSDLIKAEQKRFEQVENLIESIQVSIDDEEKLANAAQPALHQSQAKSGSNLERLFKNNFGYQLELVKKDLFKTLALALFICLALILAAIIT